MENFVYKNGHLSAENVQLTAIAEQVGTPVYVYSANAFTKNFQAFSQACQDIDALIAYSVKANSNLAVLSLLGGLGAGADVVSGGELQRALRAGISPEKIVFSGVGKSEAEMRMALEANIYQFNIESEPELVLLNSLACELGVQARIALRFNPDVNAGGHEKISTGNAENKFGIDITLARDVYQKAGEMTGIEVNGVDMHIGSQIDNLTPFKVALKKGLELVTQLRQDGHTIKTFDMGGGLGITYKEGEDTPPLPADYMDMICQAVKGYDLKMIFEPGRVIAGNAGVLLSQVRYVKTGGARNFLILDAAMNDLIRPALYGAYHAITPVIQKDAKEMTYDIVGPVCETGDTFATHRDMPEQHAGNLIAIHSAGAYGAVQSGQYNTRPLVPEVLVNDDVFAVIRKRPEIEAILELESVPSWISALKT